MNESPLTAQHHFDERLPIDGVHERLAHPLVWESLVVPCDLEYAEPLQRDDAQVRVALQPFCILRRDLVHDVQLTTLELRKLCRGLGQTDENLLDLRRTLAVVGVCLEFDELVGNELDILI